MFDYNRELEKFKPMTEPDAEDIEDFNKSEIEDIMDLLRTIADTKIRRTEK